MGGGVAIGSVGYLAGWPEPVDGLVQHEIEARLIMTSLFARSPGSGYMIQEIWNRRLSPVSLEITSVVLRWS